MAVKHRNILLTLFSPFLLGCNPATEATPSFVYCAELVSTDAETFFHDAQDYGRRNGWLREARLNAHSLDWPISYILVQKDGYLISIRNGLREDIFHISFYEFRGSDHFASDAAMREATEFSRGLQDFGAVVFLADSEGRCAGR